MNAPATHKDPEGQVSECLRAGSYIIGALLVL